MHFLECLWHYYFPSKGGAWDVCARDCVCIHECSFYYGERNAKWPVYQYYTWHHQTETQRQHSRELPSLINFNAAFLLYFSPSTLCTAYPVKAWLYLVEHIVYMQQTFGVFWSIVTVMLTGLIKTKDESLWGERGGGNWQTAHPQTRASICVYEEWWTWTSTYTVCQSSYTIYTTLTQQPDLMLSYMNYKNKT